MNTVTYYEAMEKLIQRAFDNDEDARNWIERQWKLMNYPKRSKAHWIICQDGNIVAIAAGVYVFTLLSVD